MLLIKLQAFQEGLKRGAPLAVAALISALLIVVIHEDVQVGLDFFYGAVELFPEGHLIKFVLNSLIQSFHSMRITTSLDNYGKVIVFKQWRSWRDSGTKGYQEEIKGH